MCAAAALAGLLAGLAGSAEAAETVVDATSAALCAKAAALGRADDASLQACNAAIADGGLDSHDLVVTYVNRGAVAMNRHDYAAARADFDRAIQTEPTAGEAWVDRGGVDIIQHRYRDGIADTSKGLELGVHDPAKAYYNRAVAYEGVGDAQSAYIDYQEAMVLQPAWDLPRQEVLRFTVVKRKTGGG